MAKAKKSSKFPRAVKAGPKGRKPKLAQPPLPEFEKVRHVKLDSWSEQIGRSIDRRNEMERAEEVMKQQALDYMVKNDVKAYAHAGCELLQRPGQTKLIARKSKGGASTMPGDEEIGG